MSDRHIMLDIETLDTSPRAVVLSIGAAEFDPFNRDNRARNFHVRLDIDAQSGRTFSRSTFLWWLRQHEAGELLQDIPPEKGRRPQLLHPKEALGYLADFVGNKAYVWGYGAAFDNAVLADLAQEHSVKLWSYKKDRCFRTFVHMLDPKHKFRKEHGGTPHDALSDAIEQAKYLQAIVQGSPIAGYCV